MCQKLQDYSSKSAGEGDLSEADGKSGFAEKGKVLIQPPEHTNYRMSYIKVRMNMHKTLVGKNPSVDVYLSCINLSTDKATDDEDHEPANNWFMFLIICGFVCS